MRGQYSVVFDGGTLEHVFHFPQALQNCIEMLRVGGTFIQCTPANNFTGHGFYQFSPELAFQVFTAANGFDSPTVLVWEDVRGGHAWVVANPADVRKRVQMTTRLPMLMGIIARKVANQPVFATAPQQTDYAVAWRAGEGSSGVYARPRPGLRQLLQYAPAPLERLLRALYTPTLASDCYRPISSDAIAKGHFAP